MSEEDENLSNREENAIFVVNHTQRKTRVRDHCRNTGKYRGSAHQNYNVNHFQVKFEDMKISVIFHDI